MTPGMTKSSDHKNTLTHAMTLSHKYGQRCSKACEKACEIVMFLPLAILSATRDDTPLNRAEIIASATLMIVRAPSASSKSCVGMVDRVSAMCCGLILSGSGPSGALERVNISNTENNKARTNRPLATFTNVVMPFTAMKNGLFS